MRSTFYHALSAYKARPQKNPLETKSLDLSHALQQNDYSNLYENLKLILRTLGFCKFNLKGKSARDKYYELCQLSEARMSYVIANDMYTRHINNHIDDKFLHDLIFHFCQKNEVNAGEMLNQNIWKFWHSKISAALIQNGAKVNVKTSPTFQATLFHAIRADLSVSIVQSLIERGASYANCEQELNGMKYPLMLIAVFQFNTGVLSLLADKFPKEIDKTIKLLDNMVKNYEPNKFSCDFGDYKRNDQSITLEMILKAKKKLMFMQMRQSVYSANCIFHREMDQEVKAVSLPRTHIELNRRR